MDTPVGTFFGYTVGVGAVVAALTQGLKLAESVPFLSRIPMFQWLVDTITKKDPTAIELFVAIMCYVLNVASVYIATGHTPAIDATIAAGTVLSFFSATKVVFPIALKPFEASK